MDQLSPRSRAHLYRIMSWGDHPTETSLPAWAMRGLERGDSEGACDCCGAPFDPTGACVIGCGELQEVG